MLGTGVQLVLAAGLLTSADDPKPAADAPAFTHTKDVIYAHKLGTALTLDVLTPKENANGAAIIHDFELAFAGRTSEDVGSGLGDGSFGMAEETGAFLNRAAPQLNLYTVGFPLRLIVGLGALFVMLPYMIAGIVQALTEFADMVSRLT